MNICNEEHSPEYKVVYTGAKGSSYTPAWLVCSNCFNTKKCFCDQSQILTVFPT